MSAILRDDISRTAAKKDPFSHLQSLQRMKHAMKVKIILPTSLSDELGDGFRTVRFAYRRFDEFENPVGLGFCPNMSA